MAKSPMEFNSSADAQLHSWTPAAVPAGETLVPMAPSTHSCSQISHRMPRADQEEPTAKWESMAAKHEAAGNAERSAAREGVFNFQALN